MASLSAMISQALSLEGSTRLSGLLRIGAVLLLWSAWAYPFILHFDLAPLRLALALSFYLSSFSWLLGWRSRLAGLVCVLTLLATVTLLESPRPGELWQQPHRQLSLVVAWLAALGPGAGSFSLDRLRGGGERGPLWSLTLGRAAASLLFLGTAWAMLREPELEPLRIGLVALCLVGGLGPWWRPLRLPSLVLVGAGALALYPLSLADTAPWSVVWLLACWLDPAAVHRGVDRLLGEQVPAAPQP